jgi:hypothetical protein
MTVIVSLDQRTGDANVVNLNTGEIIKAFPRDNSATDYEGMTANFYAAQDYATGLKG